MSTRSRLRPNTRKRQASSLHMVESARPASNAARSLTKPEEAVRALLSAQLDLQP